MSGLPANDHELHAEGGAVSLQLVPSQGLPQAGVEGCRFHGNEASRGGGLYVNGGGLLVCLWCMFGALKPRRTAEFGARL